MYLEYFSHLDYKKVKQYNWKECGYSYHKETVAFYLENPEEKGENVFFFPPKPEEKNIFPYSIEEIKYLEEKLHYKFPKALKELLYLFGGLLMDRHLAGLVRCMDKNYSIENDIEYLKKSQLKLNSLFSNTLNIDKPKELFVVNDNAYAYGSLSCIIPNISENPPVFAERTYIRKGENPIVMVAPSLTDFINKNHLWFRWDVEHLFFGSFRSGQAMSFLNKKMREVAFFNNYKISYIQNSYALRLDNKDKQLNYVIVVEYENFPVWHSFEIDNELKKIPKEHLILTFHWKRVLHNTEEVLQKIIRTMSNPNHYYNSIKDG